MNQNEETSKGGVAVACDGEAATIPMFSKATTLLVNTGNVVSSDRLKKKANLNPQEELLEVLLATLSSWMSTVKISQAGELKSIQCRHPQNYEKLNDEEKSEVTISVKLFLNTFDTEILSQAINTVFDEVGIAHIDTLIISFPDKVYSHDDLPRDLILPLWTVVQKSIEEKRVLSAGVSDFNRKYLEQLCEALPDSKFKPSLNQVNLTSCCKMPEDLVEYAKIHNIQLTTHIDPRDILTVENLQTTIKKTLHEYDAHGWTHNWLARYTLILKGRGIVKSKGYILSAQRELRYTK